MKTINEILLDVANSHSYETWSELMNDTHEHSQLEYTEEAMKIYSEQERKSSFEKGYERRVLEQLEIGLAGGKQSSGYNSEKLKIYYQEFKEKNPL